MKARKIRSIKQASFYGMMGGSLAFAIINFLIFSIFLITLAYLFISSHEDNLSKILINNMNEKQERVVDIAKSLADIIVSDKDKNYKQMFLESSAANYKDIEGILVLDNNGIITEASNDYKDFIGIDFSGKDYYKKLIGSSEEKYFVSSTFVSHKKKQSTIGVVNPLLRDKELIGMVVVLINPSIIENKELKDVQYYLVDSNGDIIFQSYEGNLINKEDNIKNSLIMRSYSKNKNSMIYRDKLINKLVMGTLRKEDVSSMYILVQYNLFDNIAILNGLIIILSIAIVIVFLFILIFSAQVSSIVTNYINIFKNEVKKIALGNYDIKLSDRYPHEEINEIIDNFNNMAHRIKLREEELQTYNEELIAANDEIKTMLSALSKTEKERKEQYLQIIWTMVNLLEIKDEYTAGHSKSVTYYAEEIAESLNKKYGFKLNVERIQIAAILHDVGKIGIDKEILNKPSWLTKDEFEIIKTHPDKGYYALKDIESLKEERKIIKYHHERYDGRGYPEGVKGDIIPLGARIVCVADAFDAMISDRPYRKGMPVEAAIEELIRNKGTQFDPFIVDVFVALLREEQETRKQGTVNEN